jgi:hypothetical protein
LGVGSDADQQRLLRRVANEWLTPDGLMLVDVFNPTWWARSKAECRLHEEYASWHCTTYYPWQSRFVDRWWMKADKSDALEQSVRCYSPPDLALLLEGTALRIEHIEVNDGDDMAKLEDAYSYLAILARSNQNA